MLPKILKNIFNKKESLWAQIPPDKIPSSTKIDKNFWRYFKKGDSILEVGCGKGRFVYSLAMRGFDVTGIDINKKAVDLLSEDAWFFGSDVYYENILSARFKKKFKGVLLQGVLCSMGSEDRLRCLNKVKSVMEKGGYAHIAEFEMNDKYKKRYEEDFKLTGEYGTLSIKDRDTGGELCWSHNFYEEELTGLIKKAGFEIIDFKRMLFKSYHGEKKPGMMIIAKN